MKRTSVQLTDAQARAVSRIAKERYGGNESAALREALAAGLAIVGTEEVAEGRLLGLLSTEAARQAWTESRIEAAREAHEKLHATLHG